ncbi:unnamed protein product [Coffea canephora]|uniref:Glycosyltransferase n=1 Tax=Coffea canephora TaxID=49390 RepID=A0A068V603_COFCA|nr:unnamed protein product [Coffea canephora]
MDPQTEHLHFLLIPLMAQSHIIPLTDFAKLLARQGPMVSMISTPKNANRFKALIDYAERENLKIQFITIPFPGQQVGLPEGCENLDALPSTDLKRSFVDACSLMQEPIENVAKKQLQPRPSCIISTNALVWTQNLAHRLGIPRYVFQTVSSFTLVCAGRIGRFLESHDSSDLDAFWVPNLPHKIQFRKSQLPFPVSRKESGDVRKETQVSDRGSLVNSFEELDQWYVEEQKRVHKNFWDVGPVSLINSTGSATAKSDHYSLKWLDSMKPSSVIYACFGSMCHLSFRQLREIGLGLEASGRPFIWVIREIDYSPQVEKWLKDEKFEERVKGVVVRGWAPQVPILSHSSVGGFLTHCGWNSTLEGICAAVPMLCWPMFAEQFYNEKFVVDVVKIGVRIGVETHMRVGEEEKTVDREQIKAAIDQLMDEGEEGQERRETARKLSEMARNATQQGGSSYRNVILLIQDVLQLQQQEAAEDEKVNEDRGSEIADKRVM